MLGAHLDLDDNIKTVLAAGKDSCKAGYQCSRSWCHEIEIFEIKQFLKSGDRRKLSGITRRR
jgi:hypothetical protein